MLTELIWADIDRHGVFKNGDPLDEALAIYRDLVAASNQFHDARDEKLSAKGYAKIVLTVRGVAVPLGDPATLGARLCEALA